MEQRENSTVIEKAIQLLNEKSEKVNFEGFCVDIGKMDKGIFQLVYADGKYIDVYAPSKVMEKVSDGITNGSFIKGAGYIKIYTHDNIAAPRVQLYCIGFDVLDNISAGDNVIVPNNNPKKYPSKVGKIAVITSSTSAGYGDFKTRIGDRLASKLVPYFVHLTGNGAVQEIVKAISKANLDGVDIVCLVRGGGDKLNIKLVFDNRKVCEAITSSNAPVYVAVGHSEDVTNSDIVSDAPFDDNGNRHYFATPTELAVALQSYYNGLEGTVYVKNTPRGKYTPKSTPTSGNINYALAAVTVVAVLTVLYLLFAK